MILYRSLKYINLLHRFILQLLIFDTMSSRITELLLKSKKKGNTLKFSIFHEID